MSRSVPRELWFGTDSSRAAAEIAAVMLDHGILRESDWSEWGAFPPGAPRVMGAMETVVSAGLNRWVNEELGCGELRFVRPELVYTDNIEGEDENGFGLGWCVSTGWANAYDPGRNPSDNPQAGAFLLAVGDTTWGGDYGQWGTDCFLGTRIQQLESLRRGAGWSVYGLVREALRRTVTACHADGCYDFLQDIGAFSSEYQADDEEGGVGPMTTERFTAAFPEQLFRAEWDRGLVERTITAYRRGKVRKNAHYPDATLLAILEAALQLADVYEPLDWKYVRCHLDYFHRGDAIFPAHPARLRWSEDDPIDRVWDDWLECLADGGDLSDIVWANAFAVDRPDSIRRSLQDLAETLRVVGRADRLLQLLHQPTSLANRLDDGERVEVRIQL